MAIASWLHWRERGDLAVRLEELAEHFPTRHDFDVWRAGVLAAFIGGTIAFVGDAEGGWLLQGGEGCWAVIATLGQAGLADTAAIFAAVRAEADLVVWGSDVGEGWAEQLGDFGARSFVRKTYVQDLARVDFRVVDDAEVVLAPWNDGPFQGAAIALLASANARSLEGMFLTLPLAPTLEHCQRAFERVSAGQHGELLGWASFVALSGGRVVGALMCVQGEHAGQGTLFDLYVDPAMRGRQLSRRLVSAMQGALLAAGYRENRFLTMGENVPVHRLFREEEITETESDMGGYWQRAEAAG